MPPGDELNVSWNLSDEALGSLSNPETVLLQKLDAIQDIRVIRGNLVISSDDIAYVSLPNLEEIHGSLTLNSDTVVELPALTYVGRDVNYIKTSNNSSAIREG